jgi:DNA polymerase-3 subunit gamma/tau
MTLLSALQLLDETIVKMRHSVQSPILLEVALVQICNLQDLQSLSDLVKAFANQTAPTPRTSVNSATHASQSVESKKKVELSPMAETQVAASPTNYVAPKIYAKEPIATAPSLTHNATSSLGALDGKSPIEIEPKTPDPTVHTSVPQTPVPPTSVPDIALEAIKLNIETKQSPDTPSVKPESQRDPTETTDKVALLREEAVKLGGLAGECAMMTVRIDTSGDNQWKICLSRDGAIALNYFQTGENGRKLANAISSRIGRDIHFDFVVTQLPTPIVEYSESSNKEPNTRESPGTAIQESQPSFQSYQPVIPQAQLIRNAMIHPLIKQFMEVFEGQVVRVDVAQNQVPTPNLNLQKSEADEPADASLKEKHRNEVRLENALANNN